ncbi:unnamed protein product [Symbiodinium sp. KB8]|nr:unnamed protein product [Symbiodinium sp. KB8]
MAGLSNLVRARAEVASWPQFQGHFEAEEARVEEGKAARKTKAKAKVWPKRTPEEEAEKKKRQRAKRAVKWPAEVAAKKEEEARKRREAREAETEEERKSRLEKAKRKRAEKWEAMNPYEKARLATLREGTRGGRRWEVAWRRIADGRWNMDGPLAPEEEEVEQNWCGEEFWWGERTLEEAQEG